MTSFKNLKLDGVFFPKTAPPPPSGPESTPEVELALENGDVLLTEDGGFLISE